MMNETSERGTRHEAIKEVEEIWSPFSDIVSDLRASSGGHIVLFVDDSQSIGSEGANVVRATVEGITKPQTAVIATIRVVPEDADQLILEAEHFPDDARFEVRVGLEDDGEGVYWSGTATLYSSAGEQAGYVTSTLRRSGTIDSTTGEYDD